MYTPVAGALPPALSDAQLRSTTRARLFLKAGRSSVRDPRRAQHQPGWKRRPDGQLHRRGDGGRARTAPGSFGGVLLAVLDGRVPSGRAGRWRVLSSRAGG